MVPLTKARRAGLRSRTPRVGRSMKLLVLLVVMTSCAAAPRDDPVAAPSAALPTITLRPTDGPAPAEDSATVATLVPLESTPATDRVHEVPADGDDDQLGDDQLTAVAVPAPTPEPASTEAPAAPLAATASLDAQLPSPVATTPAAALQAAPSSILRRRDVPPAGVEAQVRIVGGGADPEVCRTETMEQRSISIMFSASSMVAAPGYPPSAPEVGSEFRICFKGFLREQAIEAQVHRPDGRVERRTIEQNRSNGGSTGVWHAWEWAVFPGDPLGEYAVTATQGQLQANGHFTVSRATVPRTLVLPREGPPGATFNVGLAGFAPQQPVLLSIYHRTVDSSTMTYLTSVEVRTDDQGQVVYTVATSPDDPDGLYTIETFPVSRNLRSEPATEYFGLWSALGAAKLEQRPITIYFGDPSGSLFVPVERTTMVENMRVAAAAIRELVRGPTRGLLPLMPSETRLLDLKVTAGTATVNFDRRPSLPQDDRGLIAIVLSLTEFPSIERVQFQVSGENIGVNGTAAMVRPVVNPLNPDNLPNDVSATSFLPLYFPAAQGGPAYIRVTQMVPKTTESAAATVRALLRGPGAYASLLRRVIPEETELRDIRLEGGTISVDLSHAFARAEERDTAVRTLVASLTTFSTIKGVRISVEGQSLAKYWGPEYGKVFERPAINPTE